jgi:hypothetical protein
MHLLDPVDDHMHEMLSLPLWLAAFHPPIARVSWVHAAMALGRVLLCVNDLSIGCLRYMGTGGVRWVDGAHPQL